jgi:hypothetical protein
VVSAPPTSSPAGSAKTSAGTLVTTWGTTTSGIATERVLRWLRLDIVVSDEGLRDCAPGLARRVLDERDEALRDVVTIGRTTSLF